MTPFLKLKNIINISDDLFSDILFICMKNIMENDIWGEKNLIEQKKNLQNNIDQDQSDFTKNTRIESTAPPCNDIGKISGIYIILNKINNKYQVGSSVKLNNRNGQHWSLLRCNKHGNPKLQNAWNKYGEENFEFHVVELVNKKLNENLRGIVKSAMDKLC